MNDCMDCKWKENMCKWPCDDCVKGDKWEEKPFTNADHIRAMTDEELAEWRASGQCPSPPYHGDYDCMNVSCEDCWLAWLQKEADE